jgi:hypothetical protein
LPNNSNDTFPLCLVVLLKSKSPQKTNARNSITPFHKTFYQSICDYPQFHKLCKKKKTIGPLDRGEKFTIFGETKTAVASQKVLKKGF